MQCCNKIEHYLTDLILVAGLCFSIAIYAAEDSLVTSSATDGMHFRVSYQSKLVPLPLNQIHSWILHVETLDSQPVEKAEISVYGGMPAHKHGLPTEPVVSEIGDGDYLVEGVKFNMGGKWQLWFKVRAGDVTDEVKFDIEF